MVCRLLRQWRSAFEAKKRDRTLLHAKQLEQTRQQDAALHADAVIVTSATVALQSARLIKSMERMLKHKQDAAQIQTKWIEVANTCTQPLAVFADEPVLPSDAPDTITDHHGLHLVFCPQNLYKPFFVIFILQGGASKPTSVFCLDSTEGRGRTRRRISRRHIPEAVVTHPAPGSAASASASAGPSSPVKPARRPVSEFVARTQGAAFEYAVFVEQWLHDKHFVRLTSLSPADRGRLCISVLPELVADFPQISFPSAADLHAMVAANEFESIPLQVVDNGLCASCKVRFT
jgi:hypothetical protein